MLLLQWHWMELGYDREQRAFDFRATTALHKAASDIARIEGRGEPSRETGVRHPGPGRYAISVDTFVAPAALQHLLTGALYEEDLPTQFEYALVRDGTVVYNGPLRTARVHSPAPAAGTGYQVQVFFPHASAAMVSGMQRWGLATLGLLIVLGFFGYCLFIAFEQRRLQEIKKDFVMNMTHEFKTPLSSIRLAADVLKNPSILQSPQRLINYATIIADEAAQLTAQVDRVLQVTRVEEGAIQMRQEPVVWQDLLQTATRSYQQTVADKAGHLHLHLPERPVHFTGDAQHLQAAVGNLVDNALKYCRESPEIHIFLKNFRKNIHVTVQDNGIGIGRQHQKMLFRKFYRVPTGNIHNVRGYGLGLNYVRVIAGAHGGTVECHSRPGAGASFTMVFPG